MSHDSSRFDTLLSELVFAPLSTIKTHDGLNAGYADDPAIVRYASEGLPVYTAWHHIDGAKSEDRKYSPLHEHPYPELNLLIGGIGELVYRIALGEEEREVTSPAVLMVPAGTPHSANYVRGHGEFIAIRLDPEQLEQSS
jgi:hypothetical protein